ncbi:GGDEF domain/EAL domain protein, partial [Pseudomonas savastanoi pv. glycinea]
FGTGYSSLMYLKRLPANEIKIDRGFVRDLEHDTDDAAIVSAIVAVGQALNLRIVAEGVETAVQKRFLTHLGCHSLQGFLLGYPLPAEQFSRRNSRRRGESGSRRARCWATGFLKRMDGAERQRLARSEPFG